MIDPGRARTFCGDDGGVEGTTVVVPALDWPISFTVLTVTV
jgi:hypothetical protein